MPVISLTADPGDLFDNQTGIYGNGAKYEEYLAGGGRKDGEILDQYIEPFPDMIYPPVFPIQENHARPCALYADIPWMTVFFRTAMCGTAGKTGWRNIRC